MAEPLHVPLLGRAERNAVGPREPVGDTRDLRVHDAREQRHREKRSGDAVANRSRHVPPVCGAIVVATTAALRL